MSLAITMIESSPSEALIPVTVNICLSRLSIKSAAIEYSEGRKHLIDVSIMHH